MNIFNNFFRKYIDKRKLYTDLFRIFLVGIFLIIWENKNDIVILFNDSIFPWIGILLTYEISIPIFPVFLLVILLIYSSYIINRLIRKKRIKSGKTVSRIIYDWEITTEKNTPQWTNFKEIDLNNELFKRIKLNIQPNSEYLRFGFKLLAKDAKTFGSRGILNDDNNILVHIGKQINDDRICYTSYLNGHKVIKDAFAIKSKSDKEIKLELEVDNKNKLMFKINDNQFYSTPINSFIRERLILLAWGDGFEYNLKIKDIELNTIK
ncbi:MAG: hypothetical protein K9H49_02590 [Bacteroidales bacterium]|nr:hypothetical protein [Bacteroidales bacterium]MCF8403459.1 hypothetical protein [Bacteroidales bacterium]